MALSAGFALALRLLSRGSSPLGSAVAVARLQDRAEVYNILWVLVFAFATINILGLVARRFETERVRRLNFGELIAVMVVVVAVVLLSSELLYIFHVFPLKLRYHR